MVPRPNPRGSSDPHTDREDFRRLLGGDAAGLEALFRQHADRLCAFAFAYTQSRDAAEEIVQELFIWLWEHRSAIEPPRSVTAYLHGAVRNRALNHRRERATQLRIYESHTNAGGDGVPRPFAAPDALAEARDLRAALARAVADMPLRCREVFTLARHSQLTYGEIAGVLGISVKTVEIHMSRALGLLRERLALWRTD